MSKFCAVRYNEIQAELQKIAENTSITIDLRVRARYLHAKVEAIINEHSKPALLELIREVTARLTELEKEFNS